MNISSDLFTATMTPPSQAPRPEPQGEGGSLPSHVTAIEKLGGALSEDVSDSLLKGAQDLQDSGAGFEEVRAFVNNELQANGIEVPEGGQRSGQLVNMYS